MNDNPLLQQSGLPAFHRITPAHIAPAVETLLQRATTLLTRAENAPLGDWDELMSPLGKIDLLFEYGWSPVNHLLGVANSEELRVAHQAVLAKVVEFSLTLKQSQPLYDRFCALRDSDSWNSMTGAQQRIIEQFPPHVHYVEPFFGGGAVLLAATTTRGIDRVRCVLWD